MNEGLGADAPLLTDLYQLTMAAAAYRSGAHRRDAVFHLFYRRAPFGGNYALAAGLEPAMEWLERMRFAPEAIEWLRGLEAPGGGQLLADDFLAWLASTPMSLDVDAMPEGSVSFAHEPLVRVRGPVVQCMLAETALLCFVGFQSLVATKAARVVRAAAGAPVLEFGLRRAQGVDGALSASRASFIGGCASTSNVLAARRLGIPVRGTHAHSWVMLFESELEAFEAYADAMPANAILLVDTYDTLEGVRHAVTIGERLAARGHRLAGIRLDSGDLAELAKGARHILDAAGLREARIVVSNDLDEGVIESLRAQGAPIDVYGVGTKLVTAYDQPALGVVYKLAAVRDAGGDWQPRVKVSEQPIKTSIPGVLSVRRHLDREGMMIGDILHDDADGEPDGSFVEDGIESRLHSASHRDLLVPIFRAGRRVRPPDSLAEVRARAASELASLPAPVQRHLHPQRYRVALTPQLTSRRAALVAAAKRGTP